MNLLIDIGNSRLKWAVTTKNNFSFGSAYSYQNKDISTALTTLKHHLPSAPTRILVANVAGDTPAQHLKQWAQQNWRLPVDFITASNTAEITLAYAQPETFGVDRFLALIAARRAYPQQTIALFACGTMITLDVIDQQGQHHGGLIAPGLHKLHGIMAHNITACANHRAEFASSHAFLAQNTAAALNQGSLTMAIGFINQATQHLKAIFSPLTSILTGGDAVVLLPKLAVQPVHTPHLVLTGLAILAEQDSIK